MKRFGLCSIVAVESSQHRFAIRWEHGLQQNSRVLNNILLDSINISEKRYTGTQKDVFHLREARRPGVTRGELWVFYSRAVSISEQ